GASGDENPEGSGAGGGGGLRATACGVYEITASQTRFIPANPYRHVLLGVIAGVLLSTVFVARRK
ncbi:MAG TPA: hypothetical protein VFL47_01280, partial [Flavisolibacter sp.]|nr:hypothetical protein [Flavisolibacter sp.]